MLRPFAIIPAFLSLPILFGCEPGEGTGPEVPSSASFADKVEKTTAEQDLEALQGTWYSVLTESDGKMQSGENRTDLHIIRGNDVVAQLDGKVVGKSVITVERDKDAKFGRVKFEMKEGPFKGKTWVGIYQVTKEGARWCGAFVDENKTPPTDFKTTEGDKYFLRSMKRSK